MIYMDNISIIKINKMHHLWRGRISARQIFAC